MKQTIAGIISLLFFMVLLSSKSFAQGYTAYGYTNTQIPNANDSVQIGSKKYDVTMDAFYWFATVNTPTFTSSAPSYGGELNIQFKKGTRIPNLGFGIEYTRTTTGPRFVNTSGLDTTSFDGYTGTPVSFPSGSFGLVSPGTYQFGGGKVKYFLVPNLKGFKTAIYADYFSATGGRNAWGGGMEYDYSFNNNFSINTYWDYNNVTGNSFPSQNLLRYEGFIAYQFPKTQLQLLVGYRGYDYNKFYNTTINGVMVGIGAHF
jgi:hypothetical protein